MAANPDRNCRFSSDRCKVNCYFEKDIARNATDPKMARDDRWRRYKESILKQMRQVHCDERKVNETVMNSIFPSINSETHA